MATKQDIFSRFTKLQQQRHFKRMWGESTFGDAQYILLIVIMLETITHIYLSVFSKATYRNR